MNVPVLAQLAVRIGGLAFVAVGGGNALVPALHEQAVSATHWLTDAKFAEAVALAQTAPGPNMLLMPLIGWETAGFAGAAVALAAFIVPSTMIAVVGARFLVRHEDHAAVAALRWALRPVAGGLMVSSFIVLLQTSIRTWPVSSPGATIGLSALAASVALAALRFKVNPLVWLGLAAILGAAFA